MIWVQYTVFGVGTGAVFALLAAGIVLTYRASGVLNFAHATTGVAGAYVNFELLERYPSLPVGVALVLAVAAGALIGMAANRFVFQPVAEASQVVKLIVSFGLSGVLQGLIGLAFARLGSPAGSVRTSTLLPIEEGITVAGASIPYQRVAVIVAGLVAAAALTWLLARTEFGIQLRALAQNPLAARLAGVDDRRIQAVTWALAGATATLAAVLVMPFGPFNPLALNGFQLKALAAALLGGFVSLPAAVAGGLGLGVLQEVLVGAPPPIDGLRGVIAPALVLVLLLIRVERFFVSEQEARAVEGDERLFTRGIRHPFMGTPRGWMLAAVGLILVTLPMSGFWTFVTVRATLFALLALSLVVLTGWTGQVSLMPGTFAGIGACLAWILDTRLGYDFVLVVPLAALATVPVCAVVGLAAVRLRPLYLAVGTVALAGLFDESLFRQGWFANGGEQMVVTRPGYLAGDHAFAVAVFLVAGAIFAFTAGFGRSRTGRAMRMVRDNPAAAEASGVNPVKYRLVAFALSAAYAGTMGALLAYLLGAFTTAEFSLLILSLTAFGLAAVGGMRSPLGSVVGAFAFVELTEVFRSSGTVSDWSTLAVGAGIILVMARSPDGLVGLLQQALQRARGNPLPKPSTTTVPAARVQKRGRTEHGSEVLEVQGVTVRFGGIVAVDHVDLAVAPGETLGIIGPNGAGKSTLLNAVSGFVAYEGRVRVDGRDVDHLLPYQRTRSGIGRTFQDARLYPSMTVRDTLESALHPQHRTGIIAEGLGWREARHEAEQVAARAEELLELVDLRAYLDHRVSELSFGTTRAVELAWLAARKPRILLLDEPASGLQQSEVAELGAVISAIQGDAAAVVIDHDVPFVTGLADRMAAMDLGAIVASGPAETVLTDPRVVESYLGSASGAPA